MEKKTFTIIGIVLLVLGIVVGGSVALFSLSAKYAVLQQPGYGEARQSLVLDEPILSVGAGCQHVAIKYRLMYTAGSTKYPSGQLGSFDVTNIYKTTIPNPVSTNNLIKGFIADHADKNYDGTVRAYAEYFCIDTQKVISAEPWAEYQLKKVEFKCTQDSCNGELYSQCIYPTTGGSYLDYGVATKGKCGVACLYDSDCASGQKCDTTKDPNACVASCGSSTAQKKCYAGDAWYYDLCDNRKSLYDDCSSTETCSNGRCIPSCTDNAYVGCYNNEVKTFNSCNQPTATVAGGVCGTSSICTESGSGASKTATCVRDCSPNFETKCYGTTNQLWSRNKCGTWEKMVQDCKAEGKVCTNDMCVASGSQTCTNKPTKPATCASAVWRDYPNCVWDTSSCVDQCAPQKKYEQCYNGNVWWFDGCDKPTLISKGCTVSQECTDNACVDKCKPVADLVCDGDTKVVQKDSCGKTLQTAQTCTADEICRLGQCTPKENKICQNKPSKTCDNAVWLDFPDCMWDEAQCTVINPCKENPSLPECNNYVDCSLSANADKEECKMPPPDGLTFSQNVRLVSGGVLALLGIIMLILGSVIGV